jgi:DNA-binding transcriptional MerR regulator
MSVQTIRSYEACGLIPSANRGPQGYRLYTPRHLQALRVARQVIEGFGWQRAQRIMLAIHEGNHSLAWAVVGACYAEIHQHLRISEAAQQIGVQASTLRFWEEQGLLHPTRSQRSRYRFYDEEQLSILSMIALLRQANYSIEAIRPILIQVAQGNLEQSIAAAEKQLKELAETTQRCVKATASLWTYIEEHSP